MSSTMRLWFAAFLALVFVIGAFAGVVVDRAWLLRFPDRAGWMPGRGGPGPAPFIGRGGGPSPEQLVADLDRLLDLTDEQAKQILAIVEAHRPQIQQLQKETREKFVAEQEAFREEIKRTLTAEQTAVFEQLLERRPGLLGPAGSPRGRGPGEPGRRGP